MLHRFLLLLAIFAEVIGTLTMKWAGLSANYYAYFLMILMICISYVFLSLALKKIALGSAYALWEGIGLFGITVLSFFIFQESLSGLKIIGILILILGIVLVSLDKPSINTSKGENNELG